MELPATLEPVDCLSQESTVFSLPESGTVWGRLLPLAKGFPLVELRGRSYKFGRGIAPEVDISFDNALVRTHKNFIAYSKKHFEIVREETPVPHTIIKDFSSNGTFVNENKIGKNGRRTLNTNDEIAMAVPYGRAYIYIENVANEYENAPTALQDNFIISRMLGRGAMGEVRLAYAKKTWTRVAVKIVTKSKFLSPGGASVDMSKQIAREIDILRSVKHPCIVEVYDVVDSDDKTFIVMELVDGGELFNRITGSQDGRLEESFAKLLFYQMLCAVKYLHDTGITHRDLKPENILLTSNDDSDCLVKVSDFGLSKFVDSSSMLKTMCGTPNYLAPEILKAAGTGAYTEAVDMWSLGVILFVMLSGYMPFSPDYTDMSLKDQILSARYTIFQSHWQHVSEEALDLVKRLLTVDASSRPSAEEALNHAWMQDDEMKQKALDLMYPRADGVAPSQDTLKRPVDADTTNGFSTADTTAMPIKKARC